MKTQVELSQAAATSIRAEVLAVPVFAEELSGEPAGLLAALDQAVEGHLLQAARAERFTGKADSALSLGTLGRLPASRLLLLGLGPRQGAAALAGAGFEALRMAAGRRRARRAAGGRRHPGARPPRASWPARGRRGPPWRARCWAPTASTATGAACGRTRRRAWSGWWWPARP